MIDKLQVLLDLYGAGDLESARKIVEGYSKEIDKTKAVENRPKGKWIEDTGLYATCSNCKENLYQAIEYKFCPNCGADMKGNDDGI